MTTLTYVTRDELKAQAKRLRESLAEEGDFLTHSEALEHLSKQYGFRDWNTLSAKLGNNYPKCPFVIGQRVAGHYLSQEFKGEVYSVQTLDDGHYRVTIIFDDAVDVVQFDSFSAFRRRVTCVLDKAGRSINKTSDGVPHMMLRS